MAHEVFISYSSADRGAADAVCQAVEKAGCGAWMAPRDIVAGTSWGEAIIDAINGSRAMVLVFSASSDQSTQVLREVERAVAKRIPIIPVRIENVLPSKAMEYFLSSSHWFDAHGGALDSRLAALAQTVQKVLQGEASRPPPMPAARQARGLSRRTLVALGICIVVGAAAVAWRFVIAPGASPPAIAVLPFKNLNGDPSVDYLSLALPAELNSQLSRTSGAVIRPLDSVKAYKNQEWTAAELARTLGVTTVVAGTYWRADQQLRMNVDIVDSKQNRQVWSESFQALVSDLLKVVDLIVPKVAAALRLRLEAPADVGLLGTRNPQAYELYLRGLALNQEITQSNNDAAIRLLQKAVALEPSFAHAYSALADAYVSRFYWNFSNDTAWLDRAEDAARSALKADASLPEAHFALAYALEGKGRRADAVRGYLAAAKAGPNYAPAVGSVARWLFYMGDFNGSIRRLDQLLAIDPTRNVHVRKAMCLFFLGRPKESLTANGEAERHAAGVDQITLVAFTYAWLKDFASAERMLARLEQEDPKALSLAEIRAWIFTMKGDTARARKQMEIISSRPTYGIADELATLYAIQGEREQALAWLAKAIDNGAPNYAWYSSDFFKTVRDDARYQALLKRLSEEYRPLLAEAAARDSTGHR